MRAARARGQRKPGSEVRTTQNMPGLYSKGSLCVEHKAIRDCQDRTSGYLPDGNA
jgi:hypothetical protein